MKNVFYDFGGLNEEMFFFINKYFNIGVFPYLLKIFSKVASIKVFILIYFLYGFYFLYKVRIVLGRRVPHETLISSNIFSMREIVKMFHFLINIGMCSIFVTIFCKILKYVSSFPRPFCVIENSAFFSLKKTFNYENCFHSFPSFHVVLVIMECFYLWQYLNTRIQKILAIFTVSMVTISRISLAVHFPSDVLYSVPIAFLLIFVNQYFLVYIKNIKKFLIRLGISISLYKA